MVGIDCLLTCVHCFLHRCEALWQHVLNVSQLQVHNNVRSLEDRAHAGNVMSSMQIQLFKKDRDQEKEKKRLDIFWRGEKRKCRDNRVSDLLKARELSKEKG